MKINVKIASSILLILVLVSTSCGGGEDDSPDQITWEDIQKEFSGLDFSSGVRDLSVEVGIGVFWDFRVVIPDLGNGETAPLFIDMHGESRGSIDAHKFSYDCYLEKGLEGLDAFMIVPNAGTEQWYSQSNQTKILGLLDLAKTYWSVDENKVVAMGYSNGGNATWFFTENAPELFSAGIAMASSYSTEESEGIFRQFEVPLYVVHGSEDSLFPVDVTQGWVEGSVGAGSTIEFVVAEGLTHLDVCDYFPHVQSAVQWLQESVWD